MVKLSEGEKKETEWWLKYWKSTAMWLVKHIEALQNGEDVEGTIAATLPAIKDTLEGKHGHK